MSPEAVLNKLRAHGLRVSTPRRVVVKTLLAADGPLTANQIAADAGAELDLATVYRNLETLEDLDFVIRLQASDGARRWLLTDGEQHDFIACHRCGALEPIDGEEVDALRTALRDRLGYEVRFTQFPIVGLCAACRSPERG